MNTEFKSNIDDSLFRLIDACCEAYDNPAFKPHDGITFCNQAVWFISERMGYSKFKPRLANEMVDLMKSSDEWSLVAIEEAQSYANQGRLVIAGMRADHHGHVVVIRPGLAGISGRWKITVPKVVNVGSENFIGKSVNWAFQEKPEVYLWRQDLKVGGV